MRKRFRRRQKVETSRSKGDQKIELSQAKPSTVQSYQTNNGSEKVSFLFMPPDMSRPGGSLQFPGGPALGRGQGTFPFRGESQPIGSNICFSCGLTGHFRHSCPSRVNPQGQTRFMWNDSQLQHPQGESREPKAAVTENK